MRDVFLFCVVALVSFNLTHGLLYTTLNYNRMEEEKVTGCQALRDLWEKAAKNAAVQTPGLRGSLTRNFSPIESTNIEWAMHLAALKCWEERPFGTPFPPMNRTNYSGTNVNVKVQKKEDEKKQSRLT